MEEGVHSNPSAAHESHWQLLQTAFGPQALVPMRWDVLCRASLVSGVLPFNSSFMADAEELAPTRPAGVVCGGKTGLMALGFASEEAAKQFLTNNPILSGTIVTRFQQTILVWLRPANRLPPSVKVGETLVITDEIVPVHAAAEIANCCSIVQAGKPLGLDLDLLTFPEELQGFFVDWVVREKFGRPLIEVSPRRKTLNEVYWAVGISKLTGLRYELSEEVFFVRDPKNQQDVRLAPNGVFALVANSLQKGNVPSSEFRPARIKAVVEAVKMFCTTTAPTLTEAMMRFVRTCLEMRAGAALNKNEAAAACKQFVPDRFKISENKLRQAMNQAIEKQFGIRESHDQGRVFHGLALRSGEVGPAASSPGQAPGPTQNTKPNDFGPASTESTKGGGDPGF